LCALFPIRGEEFDELVYLIFLEVNKQRPVPGGVRAEGFLHECIQGISHFGPV
jgi:hypothetical protein